MCLKERLQYLLKSRKGNALLLATAAAIASTFAVYFFVSITTLSDDSKQRVTHLYNAYTMGVTIKAKVAGEAIGFDMLNGDQTEDDIEEGLKTIYHNGKFVTLEDMITDKAIVVQMDPTPTTRRGLDIPYDVENSGVLIKFADVNGEVIAPTDESRDEDERLLLPKVHDVHLFVNLAGTTNTDATGAGNSPYEAQEPFYYIVMASDTDIGDDSETGLTDALKTIDLTVFPTGILAENNGGPQAETSIILPIDLNYD